MLPHRTAPCLHFCREHSRIAKAHAGDRRFVKRRSNTEPRRTTQFSLSFSLDSRNPDRPLFLSASGTPFTAPTRLLRRSTRHSSPRLRDFPHTPLPFGLEI